MKNIKLPGTQTKVNKNQRKPKKKLNSFTLILHRLVLKILRSNQ